MMSAIRTNSSTSASDILLWTGLVSNVDTGWGNSTALTYESSKKKSRKITLAKKFSKKKAK